MNIVFFGTNHFAVPSLQKLRENFDISLIITKPPKPVGRKQKLTSSPVEFEAKKLGIDFSYESKNNIESDLFVVVDYGKIIPQEILNIPKKGVINIHPSLLPKYRGASPIQTAILNGEEETAISIMLVDEEMDHGPILAQKKVEILPNETYGELYERLSKIAPEILVDSIKKYLSKELAPKPQNHEEATFTKILKREDGAIDWNKSTEEIEKMVRAYDPWPGTYTDFKEKRIKILKASVCKKDYPEKQPGQFFKTPEDKLAIKCGSGTLLVHSLQPEGKKEMSGEEFIRGYLR